jgi:hypothetical protein
MNFFQTIDNCNALGQTATPAAASATRLVIAQRIARIKNVNFDGPIRGRRLAQTPTDKQKKREQAE